MYGEMSPVTMIFLPSAWHVHIPAMNITHAAPVATGPHHHHHVNHLTSASSTFNPAATAASRCPTPAAGTPGSTAQLGLQPTALTSVVSGM